MSGTRKLFVFGAGGHGKVVADVARSSGWEVAGFVDDAPERRGSTIWGLPVRSLEETRAALPAVYEASFALGVGDNGARQRCHARLRDQGLEVVTVIHARATVALSASIGPGTVVMANAVVNPDARLGTGCIVNTGAVVEHDCVLGDYAHLSPNAALGGNVTVGARAHLGLGAVAIPGTRIGDDARVGAGGAVIWDVGPGLTVVGVPARTTSKGRQPA